MPETLLVFPYFLGFFFFAVGLFSLGQVIEKNKISTSYSIYNNFQIPLRPLRFVIAIVIFSGICNAILILPAVAEGAFSIQPQTALALHQVGINILKLLVVLITCLGLCSMMSNLKILPLNIGYLKLTTGNLIFRVKRLKVSEIFFIALACSSYFYNTIFKNPLVYDMGLYHLPFVKHLVQFGPEIGLANLHDRYGFYNIQLFGQAPIQSLAFNEVIVSPSLNILFLAGLMAFAYQSIESSIISNFTKIDHDIAPILASYSRLKCISIISYWFTLFAFGLHFSGSLFAYNSDFSTSIVSGIICFALITGSFFYLEILLLLFSLPLMKLSGVVTILYAVLFTIVSICGNLMLKGSPLGPSLLGQMFQAFKFNWKPLAIFVVCFYSIYFTTNVVLSGYLIFPQYQSGPISSYAVPHEQVFNLKEKWITGWARFSFDAMPEKIIVNASVNSWLPQFVETNRGKKILFWIVSSFFIALFSILGLLKKRKNPESLILLSSAISIGIVAISILLVLPPDPRFYSWVNGLVLFNSIQLILLAPFQGLIAFSALTVGISTALPNRIAEIEPPQVVVSTISKVKALTTWRTRKGSADDVINIRHPAKGDQCWSTEPPCSAYKNKSFFNKTD